MEQGEIQECWTLNAGDQIYSRLAGWETVQVITLVLIFDVVGKTVTPRAIVQMTINNSTDVYDSTSRFTTRKA